MSTEPTPGPKWLPKHYIGISAKLNAAVAEELKAFEGETDYVQHAMAHQRVLMTRGSDAFDSSDPSDRQCLEEARDTRKQFLASVNGQMAEDLKVFSTFDRDDESYLPVSSDLASAWAVELETFGARPSAKQHALACQQVLAKHGETIFQKDSPADMLCLQYARSYDVRIQPVKFEIICRQP